MTDVTPLSRRIALAGLALVTTYAVAAAWVFPVWAMLAAQAAVFALTLTCCCLWLLKGTCPTGMVAAMPLAAAALWGGLQLQSGAPADVFAAALAITRILSVGCALVLALDAFADETNLDGFLLFSIFLGTVTALLALLQLFLSDGRIFWIVNSPHTLLPMGPFLSRDTYAAFIELILPVSLWKSARSRTPWLFGACSGLMYASVIVSLSRAGSFLVSLEVIAVTIAVWRSRPRTFARAVVRRAIVAPLCIVALTSLFGWLPLLKRFNTTDLWQMRREYFHASIAMIRDRPWMGFGLGSWPIVYPRFAVVDLGAQSPHAHNDWLEWAADGGIPFAFLMLILPVFACKRAVRRPWAMGVVAVCLHALVDFPFQVYSVLLLFFLFLAAVQAPASTGADEYNQPAAARRARVKAHGN